MIIGSSSKNPFGTGNVHNILDVLAATILSGVVIYPLSFSSKFKIIMNS